MRLILLILLATPLLAQQAQHGKSSAPMQHRQIKALSEEQILGYRDGAGMGLALAAELNGFPGPKHVLELAEQLELTMDQRAAVQAVFDRMKKGAMDLGARIVAAEAALDEAFRDGSIDTSSLQSQTSEIAKLEGELRVAHLAAHLETKPLLTPAQQAAYSRLRGYEANDSHSHHH